MRARVVLLTVVCALVGSRRSVAQHELTIAAPPPGASQFDFLLGEWTVDVTSKAPNTPPTYKGVWQAWKTLNGLGIIDEYSVRDDSDRVVYSGTTLRAFDTHSGTWTMRYVDQFAGETGHWSDLVGMNVGQEIHVEQRGRTPDGRTTILKIRYFNIQPDHFSWVADQSRDGGATWLREYLRIEATRRAGPAK